MGSGGGGTHTRKGGTSFGSHCMMSSTESGKSVDQSRLSLSLSLGRPLSCLIEQGREEGGIIFCIHVWISAISGFGGRWREEDRNSKKNIQASRRTIFH